MRLPNPFRRRCRRCRSCRLCGLPHAAILADHEHEHLQREYDELRNNNAASKALLEEFRQTVEGMKAILAAMPRPELTEVEG